jgi:hypothetical protein
MFSVNVEAGILSAWKDNSVRVWMMGLKPRSGSYFIEQSCLSATVSGVAEMISVLPSGYSLPMEAWERYPAMLGYHGERSLRKDV